MGTLTSIFSARSRNSSEGQFNEAIARNYSLTKSIVGALTGISIGRMSLPDVRVESTSRPGGMVATIAARTVEPVITNQGFPDFISSIEEIDSPLDFAAQYVIGYGVAAAALRDRPPTRRLQQINTHLWPEIYRSADVMQTFEVPYRFAAKVALEGAGIDELSPPANVPEAGLPPHIASIFDPYSQQTLRGFNEALRYTRDRQIRQEEGPIC